MGLAVGPAHQPTDKQAKGNDADASGSNRDDACTTLIRGFQLVLALGRTE